MIKKEKRGGEREREKQNGALIMFCGPVKVAFFAVLCVTRKHFFGRKKRQNFFIMNFFSRKEI